MASAQHDRRTSPSEWGDRWLANFDPAQGLPARRTLAVLRSRMLGLGRPRIVLGRYRLGPTLGAGASGVVYEATDPDLRRRVAIKVLDAVDPRQQRRIRREARLLARLNHPNVVAVYDVGTAEDANGASMFIVMELVRGQTLAEWLVERVRSTREIIDAFRSAAAGLGAAHRAGVAHGDFKPSNVLVCGTRIQVGDFGLGRIVSATDSSPRSSLESDFASGSGTSRLGGTPAYAAPERRAGLGADPRSDQYSFCAALYEALCGDLPPADPRKIDRGLRRVPDLPRRRRQAIVRGLDRTPYRRWPSIAALGGQLTATGSPSYGWLALLALIALPLSWIGSPATSGTNAPRAAAADEQHPSSVPGDLAHADRLLDDGHSQAARTISDRVYRRAAELGDPALQAEAVYRRGRAEASLGAADAAKEDLTAAVWQGLEAGNEQVATRAAMALIEVVGVQQANHEGGLWWSEQTAALLDRTNASVVLRAKWRRNRARVLNAQGRAREAIELHHAALAVLERATPQASPDLATSHGDLAEAYAVAGNLESARDHYQRALDLYLETRGAEHLDVGNAWNNLGSILALKGEYAPAREALERALPIMRRHKSATHHHVLTCRQNIATMYFFEGDLDEAALRFEDLLPQMIEAVGPNHPKVARLMENLGNTHMKRRAFDDAISWLERSLLISEEALGPHHIEVATTWINLAMAELDAGKPDRAIARGERAIVAFEDEGASLPHPIFALALATTGRAHLEAGHTAEGRSHLERALRLWEHAGVDDQNVQQARRQLQELSS